MDRQQLKLMDMISAIVGALDRRELFHSLNRHNGRQHAQLGVHAEPFDAFGEALSGAWRGSSDLLLHQR
jgi:hypothetical protein